MEITELKTRYQTGETSPLEVVDRVFQRISEQDTNAWISIRDRKNIRKDVKKLDSPETQPLYGIPFAVKDNIDYAGLRTTAGCPEYAYEPQESATVVSQLIDAGAILIGKTNMDQFATGLVGTRSPYGTCRNIHNEEYISGGSSSGSAIAVARNQVAFALGTDTAGSGRIPAAFNSIVGLKPTRGIISTSGIVPACASLDCVAVFANTCKDVLQVLNIAAGFDPADPYSIQQRAQNLSNERLQKTDLSSIRVGIPKSSALEFFDNKEAESLYKSAIADIKSIVDSTVTINFEIFEETANLLYDGPWISERLEAVEKFVINHPDDMNPVVRDILEEGHDYTAIDTFQAFHKLEQFKRKCMALFETNDIDIVATPTAGTTYTINEINEEPIKRNSKLGYYTDYVNLLDLTGIAIPAGRFSTGPGFGLTLLGLGGTDERLINVADVLTKSLNKDRKQYD